MQERNGKIRTGEEKPGLWVGPGEECQGGGVPECSVLLSGCHGVTESMCSWAGRASIPAAATAEMPLGEPTQIQTLLLAVLHGCSRSLQWFPASENPRTSAVSCYRPSQSLLSLSIVPSSTCLTFFVVCIFVPAYSHLAYNSFLSYFLPVSSNTTRSQSPVYPQAFIHSPTTPSLRPSSATLLRIPLSPSCSLGPNRALSKAIKDMYALVLCFCARCQSGLHTAGKGSPAQLSVARVQSRSHWQIDVFIGMSLIARAWTGVGFSSHSSHTDRYWNYLQ